MVENNWFVVLGEDAWRRHTYGRNRDSGLYLLGSVNKGAQIGALAVNAQDELVQVNGDHIASLPQAKVKYALELARKASVQNAQPGPRAVAVKVKKQRRVPL